ncbi:MAG TPA: hypothetical protein VGQ25_01905 [Gemmatimonadales bacterium]|nr:hypothetical protein [Gemmatimonadales bacterium]
MLRLLQLEEIEGLLLDVPLLVRRYEAREPRFHADVGAWLGLVSEVLRRNRLSGSATVAGLQGEVTAAARGVIPPDLGVRASVSKRQTTAAVALRALQRATALLRGEIESPRARANDARLVARAALAVARAKGLLGPLSPQAQFAALEGDNDTRAMVTHMVGLLSRGDALIVLDRARVDVE